MNAVVAAVVLGASLAAGAVSVAAHAGPAVTPAAAGPSGALVARSLGGISCAGRSFCMGVGPYGVQAATAPTFSQIWNGRAWQPQAAVPSPLRSYRLASVSCPSSKSCLAVGGSLGRPQLSDAWNGRTWRELPVLAGSGDSELAAVACPSAQRCVAVGDAVSGAWAQLWNGASWSKLTPVAPAGSTTSAFTAISCPGPANCTAVGDYVTGPRSQRVDHALAESWNGTAWTVLPAPPSELTGLTAISCPTSAECVVAGNRTDRQVPTGSAVWNGSTWTSLTTQSPAKKPLGQILTSISCVSATDCIAVGSGPGPYDFGLGTGPFAERWTGGSSWQLLAMPDPVNIVFAPGGGRQSASGLNAISCTGPASCIAVGGAGDTQALSAYAGFAVSWNGQAWSVLRTGQVDGLMGASCGSVSHCLVTGTYLTPAGRTQALSETVDGKTVRLAGKSAPGGVLSAVSCVRSSFCLAAGEGRDIYRWNGSRWTTSSSGPVTFIDFTEVHISRMSCVSKSFCMAAGRPTFAEFWNGRKWRVRPLVTHPGNQVETILGGLSCTKPTFCLAVGEWFEATSDKGGTLAEVWNGKGWRIIHAPGGQTDNFNAVSCVKSTDCMVIGSTQASFRSAVHLIAERWNGRAWRASHPPGSFGEQLWSGGGIGPSDISCPTAASCMAVGSHGRIEARVDVALSWNGHAWRSVKVPGPGGIETVSCAAPGQCLAVGQPGIRTLAKAWNGRAWRVVKTINR